MRADELGHLQDLLEVLEGGVLALDKPGGGDPITAIHKLFQSAHNLKSGLAMAGLERAAKYFHGLEDGLDAIRRGKIPWSGEWVDRVLDAVDLVRTCLDEGSDESLEGLQVKAVAATAPNRAWGLKLADAEKLICDTAAERGEGLYRIEKFFSPGLTREEFDTLMVLDDIKAAGTLITIQPDFDGYAQSSTEIVVRFMFASPQTAAELEQVFFDPLITVKAPGPERRQEKKRGTIRFLVVDDDPLQSDLLARILQPFGEPVCRGDGDSAVREFTDAFTGGWPYPIVFLDLEMPIKNGNRVLQELRAFEQSQGIHGLDRCLIYMNSSNSDLHHVKTSFREQADGYFIKPFSLETIRKRVEDLMPALQQKAKEAVRE